MSSPKFKLPEKGQNKVLITHNADETISLGRSFADSLIAGDVVALFGELGSGKTTFVKGVSGGLGSDENVSSPTFTLIHQYEGRLPIFHFDFYRIANSDEAWQLGCEEYFGGDGVCLIEWPERVADLLPQNRIEVHFKNQFKTGHFDSREITVLRK